MKDAESYSKSGKPPDLIFAVRIRPRVVTDEPRSSAQIEDAGRCKILRALDGYQSLADGMYFDVAFEFLSIQAKPGVDR